MLNEGRPLADTQRFWMVHGRVDLLKAWLSLLSERKVLTPRKLADELSRDVKRWTSGGATPATEGLVVGINGMTLWHVMQGETRRPRQPTLLSQILIFLDAQRHLAIEDYRETFLSVDGDPAGGPLSRLVEDFDAFCRENRIPLGMIGKRHRRTSAEMARLGEALDLHGRAEGVQQTVENFRKLFQIERHCEGIDETIFGPVEGGYDKLKQPRLRCFAVYRNTAVPGEVAQMYCQLESSSEEWTLPRFRYFYRNGVGDQLESHGIIFAGAGTIYLLGGLNGRALTMVAISASAISDANFPGLQLGSDGAGASFASRLLFVATAVEHSNELPLAMVSRTQMEAALPIAGLAEATANRVHVAREDVLMEGRAISSDIVRSEVGRKLKLPCGSALLTLRDGTSFNPADERQLAFDTTLSLLTRIEF